MYDQVFQHGVKDIITGYGAIINIVIDVLFFFLWYKIAKWAQLKLKLIKDPEVNKNVNKIT